MVIGLRAASVKHTGFGKKGMMQKERKTKSETRPQPLLGLHPAQPRPWQFAWRMSLKIGFANHVQIKRTSSGASSNPPTRLSVCSGALHT